MIATGSTADCLTGALLVFLARALFDYLTYLIYCDYVFYRILLLTFIGGTVSTFLTLLSCGCGVKFCGNSFYASSLTSVM